MDSIGAVSSEFGGFGITQSCLYFAVRAEYFSHFCTHLCAVTSLRIHRNYLAATSCFYDGNPSSQKVIGGTGTTSSTTGQCNVESQTLQQTRKTQYWTNSPSVSSSSADCGRGNYYVYATPSSCRYRFPYIRVPVLLRYTSSAYELTAQTLFSSLHICR